MVKTIPVYIRGSNKGQDERMYSEEDVERRCVANVMIEIIERYALFPMLTRTNGSKCEKR